MLALTGLSASAQAVFWFASFLLFTLAVFLGPYATTAPNTPGYWRGRFNLVAAGLAVWALMQFWQAVARS